MNDEIIAFKDNDSLYEEIRNILLKSRSDAYTAVNHAMVQAYWMIGKTIVENDQSGKQRSEYGKETLQYLSKKLTDEFGKGFSVRTLQQLKKFYSLYPNANALRSQLNWTQYRLLIQISDPSKREYYELESVNNGWTARETERQIDSMLYERLLMSNDKEKVLSVARKERIPENPTDIIKDPMILEFLGLERKAEYYEKDLESALIDHLQQFLLELGNGFSFIARQKRLLIEDDEYFADLVFYNRLLRCFVVIELKTKKLTHEDLGQLQMYVNYFDRNEKLPDENPTIGILLCTAKNDEMVKMTLPKDNKTILASKYELYLPSEETLKAEVEKLANAQEKFAELTDGEQK